MYWIAIDLMPFTALKQEDITARVEHTEIAIDLMPFTALKQVAEDLTHAAVLHCNWPHAVYGIETCYGRSH